MYRARPSQVKGRSPACSAQCSSRYKARPVPPPYRAPPPPEEYHQPNVAPEGPGFLAKLFSSIAGRGRGAASNAVLSDTWIPSGGPMGLRDFRTPSEVYNTEIPVVSPFMRDRKST